MNARVDPAQLAQQNVQLRGALLAVSPRMRKNLGTVTATNGTTSRFRLFNVGILTGLTAFVTAALTIGTAIATPSTKGPYNLINRVQVTDYDGTARVNVSGFQLFILNCVRNRTYWGYNNEAATAVITNPLQQTAVGAATVSFFLDIPIAFDPNNPLPTLQDLRGAVMMQTGVGEMYCAIDWNPSLYTNGDVDSLYSGAPTTTVVGNPAALFIQCTLYQHYILPQNAGRGVPIPFLDLQTVYELNGNLRQSDNIANGAERLFNYPNNRSVIGFYATAVNNAAMAAGNVARMRTLVNANNTMQEWENTAKLFEQRLYCNGTDLVPGVYFFNHRDKPVETVLFGNVQVGITFNAAPTNPYYETMVEGFFVKGAALPGMQQAA